MAYWVVCWSVVCITQSVLDHSIRKQHLKRLVESPLRDFFFGQFFSLKVPEFLHVGFNVFREHALFFSCRFTLSFPEKGQKMRPHLLFSFVKSLNKRNQLNPLLHETKERNQQSDQCFVRCVWSLVYIIQKVGCITQSVPVYNCTCRQWGPGLYYSTIWPSATLMEKNGNAIVLSFPSLQDLWVSFVCPVLGILINNHYLWRSTVQVMSG